MRCGVIQYNELHRTFFMRMEVNLKFFDNLHRFYTDLFLILQRFGIIGVEMNQKENVMLNLCIRKSKENMYGYL